MNRSDRRAFASLSRALQPSRPKELQRMPDAEVLAKWTLPGEPPFEVWVSREFLVQVFRPRLSEGSAAACRLSVCRVIAQADGRWNAGISWDDLQRVKRDTGRGDAYAIEVYPRDRDVVNVANMRHLWIFDQPLECGWFSQKSGAKE